MRIAAVLLASALVCALFATAQESYSGPRPPKPDIPYLQHADILIETEVAEAREQTRGKNETLYTIAGAASPVRTPLAEPAFLFESGKIPPESLQLYRLEVKNGSREVTPATKRKGGRPLRLMVSRLSDRLYRIEVNEGLGLESGQYSLSPTGSNQVFCFEVY